MSGAERIIVSITDRWNGHAEDAVQGQQIPVRRIGLADLEASYVDWDAFDWATPRRLPTTRKKRLRAHHQTAVSDVVNDLVRHDRGKLVMASGTEKTFTSLRLAERLAAAVDQACRRLRLPTIRAVLGEALTVAGREQLTYEGFLAELLLAECDDRDRRSSIRRVKAAGFPRDKWLGAFDFDANTNINPATIHQLATGDWIRAGHPLCLIGDSGTSKSHLLIALGTAAAERGCRVKYTLATRLVNELVEAADEKILARTIARYGHVDLLVIDELGYMALDRQGAEMLFQVLTEREEKNSIAIASNQSFSGWTRTFTDPRLCAAIVDRLTYNGTIIETGTASYRLAHSRQQAS